MMLEMFFPQWVEWCRTRGIRTRYQAHGSPGNLLDLYALADIPETEIFHLDRSTRVSRMASSAAHVAGRGLGHGQTGSWRLETAPSAFNFLLPDNPAGSAEPLWRLP